MTNSATPKKYASPLKPSTESQEMKGPLVMNCAMPCADCGVNFCIPNDTNMIAQEVELFEHASEA